MLRFNDLVAECRKQVAEVFPWDLADMLEEGQKPLMIDVREPHEFDAAHIPDSLNVPRGVLESASEFGYEETLPVLANARGRKVVIICRSGNRSLLAGRSLQLLGYTDVVSLQTGVRGWNDYEQPLEDRNGRILDLEEADELFIPNLSPEQMAQAA